MPEVLTGRELDAAVAKKVMRWPLSPYGSHNGDRRWLDNPANYPHAEICDDGEPYTGLLLWKDAQADGVYWSPSQSIEAAMQVLTKFPMWNINKTDHPDFIDRPYSCSVSVHEREHSSRVKTFEVQAESVERGVCLAALKAVEHT